MPKTAYFHWQRDVIDRILARDPLILVARDPESPDLLYGYLVAERKDDSVILHWVYTKASYRKLNIANQLLSDALSQLGAGAKSVYYTHSTRFNAKADSLGMQYQPIERVLRPKPAPSIEVHV